MKSSMKDNSEAAAEPASPAIMETPMSRLALAGLSVLVLELTALTLALVPGRMLWAGLAIHVAAAIATAIWVGRLRAAGGDLRFPLLLLSTTVVLGPAGPAGMLVTVVLQRWFARSATSFESWYASLFPEESGNAGPAGYEWTAPPQSAQDEASVIPFMDILSFGSRQQRESMIALITTRFRPEFAPVLRRALSDSNNAIRVQAATAMTMVENSFLERSMDLTNAAKQSPGNPETLLALARHFDAYAFAGILDDQRERDNREKATQAYLKYLALKPNDLTAMAELGRILVRSGDYAEALAVLGRPVDDGTASPPILLWYMESLYGLGRYDELRRLTRTCQPRLESGDSLPVEVGEVVKLWTAGGDTVVQGKEVPA
jgi:polysaccharide biosynthesis protein PelE